MLAGKRSGFFELHESHHTVGVRAAAIYLERYLKDASSLKQEAYKLAFLWMTGYESYSDAYEDEGEVRRFTDRGVKNVSSAFNDDDDDDDEDDDGGNMEACISPAN
jgi:hypothetical protein